MEFDELSNQVIGGAIEVHRALGPGLLEAAYEQCLAHELKLKGIAFKLQCPFPVEYKDVRLDCGYRVDFFVEDSLILELGCPNRSQSFDRFLFQSMKRLTCKPYNTPNFTFERTDFH